MPTLVYETAGRFFVRHFVLGMDLMSHNTAIIIS